MRALVAGAFVLSVSILAITLAHLEQFDLARLQASAWLVLFAGFSLLTSGLLVAGGRGTDRPAPLETWARGAFGIVAALLASLAIALWLDPGRFAGLGPFSLSALGGRFAGSWIALLAALAAWAALRNRLAEARLPALALVTLPAGALAAALRTLPQLEPGAGAAYIVVLAAMLALGGALFGSTRRVTVPAVTAGRPVAE